MQFHFYCRITSPTKTLLMTAANGIHLESFKKNSRVTAGENIQFQSAEGSIRLQPLGVKMPHLRIPTYDLPSKGEFKFYQLCVCKNGKLFLASSESSCSKYERFINCW